MHTEAEDEIDLDEEERDIFIQVQPEVHLFYTVNTEDTKAMAKEVAQLTLQQQENAMKQKGMGEIRKRPCQFSCSLGINLYGSGRYCPTHGEISEGD